MDKHISTINEVVDGGFCVGCGACSFATNCGMNLNKYGEYQPDILKYNLASDDAKKIATKTCPSLSPEWNEDTLGKDLFAAGAKYDPYLGYVKESYAGFAIESNYRENGTSGGMGTWIGAELLRLGLIDGVVHVKSKERKDTHDPFFSYGISESLDEIKKGAKTRYHVVEMSQVLADLENSGKRYLFIGVPCMVKTVRKIQKVKPQFKSIFPFAVSLVCGHLKSVNWSLSLAWGAGIRPEEAKAIQYRTKGKEIPARAYVYRATDKNQHVKQQDSAKVVGGKFNVGAMMLPACDYCDDVVGETADLTIGDAWIPRFDVDTQGTNLLLVRNIFIDEVLRNARDNKTIMLENISNEEAMQSQSGGYRQRREGLSHRLARELDNNKLIPVKRIKPNSIKLPASRKKIYDGRSEVTIESREAFLEALEKDDYTHYKFKMEKKLNRLRIMELRSSFFRLAYKKITRLVLSKLSNR